MERLLFCIKCIFRVYDMKLLIVTPEIHRLGGVANHYLGLSPHWKDEVEYLFYGKKSDTMSRLLTLLLYPIDVIKYVWKLIFSNIDVVVINPSFRKYQLIRDGFFLILARCISKEVVTFFHGFDVEYAKILKINPNLFKSVYNRSLFIYVLASDFKDILISLGITKPILLTTTKVSDSFVDNITIKPRRCVKTLLYVARIIKEKGIYETIDIYRAVKTRYADLKLIVAGDGSELNKVKRYVSSNEINDITFIGNVVGADLLNTYLLGDLYILPTESEGMATTVLEAMALGLPVLTSPTGGVKDFFINGKMGYLIDNRHPQQYIEKVMELIADEECCSEISSFNINYARKHFIASKVTEKFEADIRIYYK